MKKWRIYRVVDNKRTTQRGFFDGEDLGKNIEELKEKKGLRNLQELKARKFLIEQLRARGYSIADIAVRLAVRRTTIYNTLDLTAPRQAPMLGIGDSERA